MEKQDAVSVVSSFDDEIDEWAALNKYAVLRSFQETMNRKQQNKERQVFMRGELQQQQNEFRKRQELYKLE